MTKTLLRPLLGTVLAAASCISLAADPQSAEAATADVLFNLDIENASYKVRHDGYVDISFGPRLPETDYQAAITALKAHPDIPGILAGRGSADYCPLP